VRSPVRRLNNSLIQFSSHQTKPVVKRGSFAAPELKLCISLSFGLNSELLCVLVWSSALPLETRACIHVILFVDLVIIINNNSREIIIVVYYTPRQHTRTPNTNYKSQNYKYYMSNKQPKGCDAQLAGTQTERGNVREIDHRGYIWRKNCPKMCGGKCPRETLCANVRIPFQDCLSLHAAVIVCATLVNTHTHTHRQTAFDRACY